MIYPHGRTYNLLYVHRTEICAPYIHRIFLEKAGMELCIEPNLGPGARSARIRNSYCYHVDLAVSEIPVRTAF